MGVDSKGDFKLLTYETWNVISGTEDKSKDGYIFLAWPAGMTIQSGASNCVASFVLNGRAYTPRECATNLTITADDGIIYDLYKLQIENGEVVDLYAKV